jgi:uncharacterized protein (TIGR00251 family)
MRVQPGASREAVIGKVGDEWKVAITSPPVEGQANKACIAFLSKLLRKPKRDIELVRGAKSRTKTFEIVGMTAVDVEVRLVEASK